MHLLVNLILAILGGWLAYYVVSKAGADKPVTVIIGVLVGLVVFLADLASEIL